MEKSVWLAGNRWNGYEPFFLLYSIRPAGRIFCSTEQSKLCLEALETSCVPQNNLPLQGAGKHPPKSGFC